MRFSILILAADYGPFTPHVGYVVSIVSTVSMIGFLIRGPLRNWDIPDEGIPKVLRKALGFVGAAFIVVGWFIATTSTILPMLIMAVVFALAATGFTVRYALLTPRYRFYKEVANPDGKTTHRDNVLGGDRLTPLAEAEARDHGFTEQDMLARVAYDPDKIWPRDSRVNVMRRFAVAYMLSLTLGAASVSWFAYVVQVKLTGKPASAVIRQADATGVENVTLPKANGDK